MAGAGYLVIESAVGFPRRLIKAVKRSFCEIIACRSIRFSKGWRRIGPGTLSLDVVASWWMLISPG